MADQANTDTDAAVDPTPAPAADTLLSGDVPPPEPKTLLDGEAKPEGDAPKEGDEAKADDAKDGDADASTEVPEAYEFTMPEGVELDTAMVEKFSPVFKDLELSQEKAQKLVDIYAQQVADGETAAAEAHETQREEWRGQIKSEPDYERTLSLAKRAVDRFATDPETKQLLTQTWLGDNPAIVKFLAAVGKTTSEDTFPGASAGSGTTKATALDLYPSMKNA